MVLCDLQVLISLLGRHSPGSVGIQVAHRAAQGLGAVQHLLGLDPCDVSFVLSLLAGFVG